MSKEEKQAHYAKFYAEQAAQRAERVAEREKVDAKQATRDAIAEGRAVHPENVEALCPGCKHLNEVSGDLAFWTCPQCAKTWRFLECPKCLAAFQFQRTSGAAICPWCKARTRVTGKKPNRATAWTFNREMAERGMSIDTYDQDRRVLAGCTVIGGHSHSIDPGARVTVTFDADHIALAVVGGETTIIPYSDVVTFEIEGRGVVKSGTRLMGGGFGLAGAAAGMLAATAINSLTSKTNIETVINIQADTKAVILFYDQVDPTNLKLQLSPAIARIEAAKRKAGSSPAPSNPVAQLAQLDELHKSGALSSGEFAKAKARIIESM